MKTRYQVSVPETNEIAGEVITSLAVVFSAKTLHGARECAFQKWNGSPPAGAKIVDTDGIEYSIPNRS